MDNDDGSLIMTGKKHEIIEMFNYGEIGILSQTNRLSNFDNTSNMS